MANGRYGQNIAVFPDLDIVAVVTARDYVSQFALIEGIYAAVKSESALPPNPSAGELLASAIKDAAVEKPTAVGPTPKIASTISGKTYKFPDNDLKLKSLTLFLTDSHPHVDYEMDAHPLTTSQTKYDMPIGLDGLYRKWPSTISGTIHATKGAWLNGQTFVIVDDQDLGSVSGKYRKYLLSFSGDYLNIVQTDENGLEVSADGKQSDN